MQPESIGSYRLVELLGAGAMGEVYKATDGKMFDRVVALKLLSEKFARNENARTRFQNEVQYVAHLDHPNIIKIYDHGEADGRPFFVMEFLDGIDLSRFMKDEPNRNIERSVEIARQLCEALDFAHRHNVVHRDVKPANVMIVRRGDTEQVKLVDFGIMHVDQSKMTRDGTQPGTSAYSSPEQLRNDAIDHRSDLFSLGIVLYELFTNTYPFDAPSEALITHHILQREPESPRKKNPTLPASVEVLIMKLLEKDPAQRPQSGGEVAEALRQQLRKLQSRWASTDPAEYENLDEITREAVDKLVAWARQKEADGGLQEAVDAYEKALRIAPESDRIQRRIPKLKHRIESERLLREHLSKAAEALAAGRFTEAREQWKHAWILSPESEDVTALELRIEQAEKAVPDDREKKQFVEALIARAEEALDGGRLDDARAEIVQLLQRYPRDPLANFMLERILSILMAGVDYAAYRKSIREARELVEAGRFADARARCAQAQSLWPGDEEAASVERDIDQRVEVEVAALAVRVEKSLLRAEEPDIDDRVALELLATVRDDVTTARAIGATAPWILTSSEEADRIKRSVEERIARAEAFRREQDELRAKRIDTFLQLGRSQLADADALALRVTTEPEPAIEGYGLARESFERVLQDDATHAEALDARRRIEEQLRELAVRVERAREVERELGLLLEGARTAIAEVEIAGGARAGDLGKSTALLHDADVALDRILAVDPRHSDAVPLRARVTTLRGEVLKEEERRAEVRKEEERREAQAAAARKESEAAELRRAEEERRAAEKAERDRKAEEDRAAEEERRAAEKAERDRKADEDRAAEKARLEKEKKEQAARKSAKETPAPVPPSPPAPVDSRKIAEFEKGLAKQRRLVQQGKAREAADIQKILKSESQSDPQLKDLYAAAFPEVRGGGSTRGLVWGGIAAAVVVGAAGLWFVVGGRSAPTPPTPPPQTAAPVVKEIPPEPTFKPPETPAESPSPIPVSAPVTPSEPAQLEPPPQPSKPSPTPVPKPSPPVQKPVVAPQKAPAVTTEAPKAPAPVPETAGRIQACLKLASGQPAGAGYTMGFSINGVEKETRPTNASGCASLDVEIDLAARFQPVYAKSPSGESLVVKRPPAIRIHRGETVTKDVEILP
jgi:serine/threonine protein kinase